MIKKQQKWIALLAAFTFLWLLQISAMPVPAANTTEQVGSANADQAPDFVEAVGHNVAQAKKKNILPYILIGVGVVAVAAVLFLVVLKSKYDIVGEWRYSWKSDGDTTWDETNQKLVFSGDKKSGTLAIWGYPGTYTADGKNVTFTIDYMKYGPNDFTTNIGTFVSKDKITGTWKYEENGFTGSFEALRGSATASSGSLQTHHDAPGRIGNQ